MSRMPQVTARQLVQFLKAQGFAEDRQGGSHLTLVHVGRGVSVSVPMHTGCDVGRGLAVRILKDAGFSVDDYLRLR
jgi:predicted RNA binding protein YcfA (HicA-like mRNA interferase family)